MRNSLRLMAVIMLLGSSIGVAFGATVTFDKTIDVPDREFTVEYPNDRNKTFTFTIDKIGNYKFGDSIGVTVNSGVNRMRLVSWSVDKLSPWQDSYSSPGGSVSATIPAEKFNPSCTGVCENDQMGPGIYALTVQDMVNGPPFNYITAKPFIISEYDLTVTPDKTQLEPGSSINVTVNIKQSGNLVDVSNNVKVEFVQGITHFGADATKVSTGTYEANVPISSTATGTYLLYAAITTNKPIYSAYPDYPEIMGAGSFGRDILITNSASTQTTTSSGGGGGGLSGEDYLNIEVKEKYELDILKDKIASYRFKNASNPINFINITGNISAGATMTSVEVLKDTSSLVKADAPGLVFKNMNIWVGTSGFAVPKNIKSAVIGFKVDNSWIKTNGLSSSDVKLVKWDGSQWIQLETREMDKRGEFIFYEATTNSFSPFAIVAKAPEITPGKAPGLTQQPATTQTPTEVPTESIDPTAI
ncbi:MAG: PGF-pre-PGF domain-containing protein, partial [Euryarchaeota archaeon]|nr:PGF-pre-PGF domain-containing protein [Euryarchaeota archaeon]